MSAQSDAVKTLLAADATLVAILTGGIHEFTQVGKNVLTQDALPASAYDSNGIMKPLALVHARSENNWGPGYDHANRYKSVRDVIEIYLCRDGDTTAVNLNGAMSRVLFLTDGQFVGGGWAEVINRLDDDREPILNNALYIRIDLAIVRGRYLT